MTTNADNIIEITGLKTCLGDQWVHKGIDLSVKRGEIIGIVGGSGSGKTTLLNEMLGLLTPTSGSIKIFGKELINASSQTLLSIQRRWGVLFQQNALYSSLTLLENVGFPLKELTNLDEESIRQLALLKIMMVGLPTDSAVKYPAQLSGGMQKRAGLARAIVLDPELIFLDEPSAGLDPKTAAGLDQLILNLQSTMGLTIVIITHDLDTLWTVTNRVAFLGEGKVLSIDKMSNLVNSSIPVIRDFFSGPRGRAAEGSYEVRSDDHGN